MIVTNGNQIWKNPEQFEVDGIMVAWIPGYEGIYAISEAGEIWGAERIIIRKNGHAQTIHSKWMNKNISTTGYLYINLCNAGPKGRAYIHRLVAITYIENPENKEFVDHINRDRIDNRKENLRWATRLENNMNECFRGTEAGFGVGRDKQRMRQYHQKRKERKKNNEDD